MTPMLVWARGGRKARATSAALGQKLAWEGRNVRRASSAAHTSISIEGSVAMVTLQRPQRMNAVSFEMARELISFASSLRDRDMGVRAVIITGDGDRAFSTGSDPVPSVNTPPVPAN